MRKNVFPTTAGVFQSLALAAMGSLLVTGTAGADLIDVTIEASPFQHPDGDVWDTWRVVAHFDDLADQIALVGSSNVGLLYFFTGGGDIYNQPIFDGQTLNDFPSVGIGGEPYDSYVTIGATTFPAGVLFTPNFLGRWYLVPPPAQIILGSSVGPVSNGAWFFFGEPPEVGNWGGNVVIAQFTVPQGVGLHLEGNIAWIPAVPGVGLVLTPFVVDNIPAPGALALFGLAGLAGTRRRRRQ